MNAKSIVIISTLALLTAFALACVGIEEPANATPERIVREAAAAGLTPAQQDQIFSRVKTVPADEGPTTINPAINVPATKVGNVPVSIPPRVEAPAIAIPKMDDGLVQSANGGSSGILVTGKGEVSAPPDLAMLHLGVEAFSGTVAVAREEAATAMADVRAALDARDIPEADIQTRHFRINPRYTSREVTRCPEAQGKETSELQPPPTATPVPMVPPGGDIGPAMQQGCITERQRVISGYEVGNSLVLKLRDLDTVGDIIDEVTEAGGDNIRFNSVEFSLDDPSELENQALTAAIDDAIAKAQYVAAAAGVELGDLLHLREGGSPHPGFRNLGGAGFAMEASATLTLVSGGSLEVAVSVQALYAIQGD